MHPTKYFYEESFMYTTFNYPPEHDQRSQGSFYKLIHRLSVRIKIDRKENIRPASIKQLIKAHIHSTGLGDFSKFEPDVFAYEGVPKLLQQHEFAFRFFVETEYLDQTIADLIHLLSTSPTIVGSFSISICGTTSRIIAPSGREATQIPFLGQLVNAPIIIRNNGDQQPYHPVCISPSLQHGAKAPQRFFERLTMLF